MDVALELGTGTIVGIESKFTEWLTPKRGSQSRFKDEYFEGGAKRWADRGLNESQALADDMQHGRVAFRFLDAAQLLKHALGLATQAQGRCSLRYLFFDVDCPAAEVHRAEIESFAERVDPALGFQATTYQTLLTRLEDDPATDAGYVEYLRSRYCPRPFIPAATRIRASGNTQR